MSTQKSRRFSLYGYPGTQAGLQQEPIVQQRDPNTSDNAEIGTIWCNTISQSFFILCSSVAGVNTWTSTTAGATTLTSLTVDPGNITVAAGDVIITAGDLTMDAGSTATLGSLSAGATTLTSTLDVTGAATFGSTVAITGNVSMAANLDVTGDVTVSGDFDITSAAALSFTTTSDTNPAISFTANGGTSETIVLQSTQGTSASSINLLSSVGGVTIQGNFASADAVNILSGATGGIDMDYGSAGMTITGANGNFTLETGTGDLNIGTDAVAKAIVIGNAVGATGISIESGSAGTSLTSTADVDISPTLGFTVAAGDAIAINSTGGAINLGNNNDAQAINIGTGAAARTITVGNNVGASALSLVSGTGDITAASADALLLDAVGVLEINSSGGVIGIGNDAVAQNINIGTGAAARTITMGNVSGATSVVLNVGTGALNLGTSATAHATNVGSTTAGSTLVLNTPTGTDVLAANGLSVTTAGRGLSLPGGLLVLAGAGDPNGVVTAPIGSMFLRSDPAGATSRAYINTDAGTTWTNITCAG